MRIAEYKSVDGKMEVVYRDATQEEAEMMSKCESPYKERVVIRIREKYSVDDEFAILRQKEAKPDEYASYYAYCEECKAYVKGMIKE